jgi:hypothetical protein
MSAAEQRCDIAEFASAYMQKLKKDVEDHCSNGDYNDKTVMFCWEHKNIPYIVAKFGLTKDELTWGLNPFSGVSLLCS